MVWRVVTGLAYLAVLGLAMAGSRRCAGESPDARLIIQVRSPTCSRPRFTDRLGQELDRIAATRGHSR